MFNKKDKVKIMLLENRIQELEEKLCPKNEHDFYVLDKWNASAYEGCGSIEVWTERVLKCSKCGKVVMDNDRLRYKYKLGAGA